MDVNVIKLLPKQKNMVSVQLEKALDWIESTMQNGVKPISKGTMRIVNYDSHQQQKKGYLPLKYQKGKYCGYIRTFQRMNNGCQIHPKERHTSPMLSSWSQKMKQQSLLSQT